MHSYHFIYNIILKSLLILFIVQIETVTFGSEIIRRKSRYSNVKCDYHKLIISTNKRKIELKFT